MDMGPRVLIKDGNNKKIKKNNNKYNPGTQ